MIKEYIYISENILSLLREDEVDDIQIKKSFDKRQEIINSLNEEELKNFGSLYKDE